MRTNALGPFQPQPRVQLEDLLATKAVSQRDRRAGHRGLGFMENVVPTCARSGLIDALQVPLVLKNKPSLRFQISVGKFPIDQPQRTLRESRLSCQSFHRYHHSSNGETSIVQAGRRHLWPLCGQLPRRLRFYFTFRRQRFIHPAIGVAASCCTFSNFIPRSKNDQSRSEFLVSLEIGKWSHSTLSYTFYHVDSDLKPYLCRFSMQFMERYSSLLLRCGQSRRLPRLRYQ